MPHNSRIPGPILRFDWRLLHSGNSSFLGSENANPCVFSRSLGSFPLFSIFFAFLPTFSLRRADSEPPSPPRLQACSCDNSHRLPPLEPLVKSKMKDRIQVSGFGIQQNRGWALSRTSMHCFGTLSFWSRLAGEESRTALFRGETAERDASLRSA